MKSFWICLSVGMTFLSGSGVRAEEILPDSETLAPYGLNIKYSSVTYDSIIANWKSFGMRESFENFVPNYIERDTNALLPIPIFTDTQFRDRLEAISTPIHLPFNPIVKERLVAFTTTHKGLIMRMLAYSQYYFPIFEAELERQGLPQELKFLPVIESALTPTAISRVGAVGLWQFMLPTGKQYGLEISSLVDERRDPVSATRAACQFLKDLYRIYEDWTLVLASYNYGPGNVNKAIRRAGPNARTYWDIYPYLPRDTRDYVPAFVAVTYAYHYYRDHNIIPGALPIPLATDTVMIDRNLHLGQVSSTLGIPIEMLEILNPQYKLKIIPAVAKNYPLVLPQQEVTRFLDNEEAIYAKDSIYLKDYLKIGAGQNAMPAMLASGTTYKVKSGDTLGAIARRYGVTVNQLMRWNNLNNSNLRIGQVIRIDK